MFNEVFRGVVHGKTIELEQEPGLPDGQSVTVTVALFPAPTGGDVAVQEAMQRAFGAWSEDAEELDKFLKEVRNLRKVPRRGVDE